MMTHKRSPATAGTVDREDRYAGTAGRYAHVDEKASPRPPAPWFRFWVERWFTMTRNLGPVEVTALLAIMAETHQRGEPYPEDHARLAKRCRTTKPAMSRAIEALVEEQLVVRRDGGLWSEYIGDEIDHRGKRAEVAAQNVKKRWGKTERNQSASDTKADKSLESREEEDRGGGFTAPPMSPSSSMAKGVGTALGSASPPSDVEADNIQGSALAYGDYIQIPGHGLCAIDDGLPEGDRVGRIVVITPDFEFLDVEIRFSRRGGDHREIGTVAPYESEDEDPSIDEVDHG